MTSDFEMSIPELVDIHGRDIPVELSKTGEILVPLNAVRQIGFNIYPKKKYNKLLIDETQLKSEFNLYLLEAAKTYLLENKIRFKPEEILESIDTVKNILLGTAPSSPRSNFLRDHDVREGSDQDLQITAKQPSSYLTTKNLSNFNKSNSPKQILQRTFDNLSDKSENSKISCNRDNGNSRRSLESNRQRAENFDNRRPISKSDQFEARKDIQQNRLKSAFNNGYNKERENDNQIDKKRDNQSQIKPKYASKDETNGNNKEFNGIGGKRKILSTSNLELHQSYDVTISHIETMKNNVIWVQNKKDGLQLLDIFQILNKTVGAVTTPEVNKVCCAEDEGSWFRCRVVSTEPFKVFFVDYGNTIEVKEVREIPEEIKTIPDLAIRMSFRVNDLPEPKIEQELKIKPTQHFEDGTYFCHLKPVINNIEDNITKITTLNNDTNVVEETTINTNNIGANTEEEVEKTDVFFKVPKESVLENNMRVVIMSSFVECFILRNKENCDNLMKMQEIFKENVFAPLEEVSIGQLVVAQKLHEIYPCRAIIESINGDMIGVKFLDFHNEYEKVSKSTLKAITEELALIPIIYIKSPELKGFENLKFNDKCNEFIQSCITDRLKFSVELKDGNFDLLFFKSQQGPAFVLSKKLLDFLKPDCVMISDLETCKTDLGIAQYTIYLSDKIDLVTLIQESEDVRNHLEKVFITDLEDDSTIYKPVIGEVCLAKFEDAWYRSVITGESANGYVCYFVDFGNEERLTGQYLKKLPEDLKSIPILGIKARFVGIDASKMAALKNLVTDGDSLKVNLVKLDGEHYNIELPDLYKKL